MSRISATAPEARPPQWGAYLQLLKPITWFPPMWAFACGLVASGADLLERWPLILAGVALAGPLICGTSQVVNDWFDRHVDAINEPDRPIPSGRVPGRRALWFAVIWTVLSLAVAFALGPWVAAAGTLGMIFAWIYSAPPLRLKQNGWFGNAACGLCYEGLPWFTAAAVASGAYPGNPIVWLCLLYSAGAHGIMTLNDFKAIEGDREMGIRSLPAQLGADRAARLACWVMAVPQVVVIGLLIHWNVQWAAITVGVLLLAQVACMLRLLTDPKGLAPWYNATGISLYVSGMMVSAVAVRGITGV